MKKCPICGQPASEGSPFCSSRCAYIDLGRWLSGTYRIPTNEPPEEGVDTEAQTPYMDKTSQESGR